MTGSWAHSWDDEAQAAGGLQLPCLAGLCPLQELTEPLLQQSPEWEGASPSPSTPPQAVPSTEVAEAGGLQPLPCPPPVSPRGGTPQQQLLALTATVWKQRSLPPLVQFNQLEPWNALSSERASKLCGSLGCAKVLVVPSAAAAQPVRALFPPVCLFCSATLPSSLLAL